MWPDQALPVYPMFLQQCHCALIHTFTINPSDSIPGKTPYSLEQVASEVAGVVDFQDEQNQSLRIAFTLRVFLFMKLKV